MSTVRSLDHGTHLRRRQLHGFRNRTIEPRDPCCCMLDLVQVIQQRGFLRHLFEMYFLFHPFQVLYRPKLYPHRRSSALPQQKLIQPMPCSKFIFLGRFPGANQIPQRLVSRIRHPHRR